MKTDVNVKLMFITRTYAENVLPCTFHDMMTRTIMPTFFTPFTFVQYSYISKQYTKQFPPSCYILTQ